MRIGTVDFGVHFDRDSRTVRLIGEEVTLGDRNVILVDRIDGAGGPSRIANVLRISTRLSLVRRPEPEGMRSDCLTISSSAGDSTESTTLGECMRRPTVPADSRYPCGATPLPGDPRIRGAGHVLISMRSRRNR